MGDGYFSSIVLNSTPESMADRSGQVMKHVSSADKAFQLLGWKAQTDFGGGLVGTIEWYKQNPAWWQKLLWMRHVPIKTKDRKVAYY